MLFTVSIGITTLRSVFLITIFGIALFGMIISRHTFLFQAVLIQIALWGAIGSLSAQSTTSPFPNGTFQPVVQQRIQAQPIRQQPMSTNTSVTGTLATGIQVSGTQEGLPAYLVDPSRSTQQPMQTGINTPPYAQPIHTQSAGVYPLNSTVYQQDRVYSQPIPPRTAPTQNRRQPPFGQQNVLPPIRTAQSVSSTGQTAGQSYVLYDPNSIQQPVSPQSAPISPQPIPAQRQSVPAQPIPTGIYSAAQPVSRVVPFELTPVEQRELDEFLAQWEKTSSGIKRYDVNFDLFEYDPTIPGAVPNQPARICFGYFKYINNPVRFVYVVEGEWRGKDKIKRDANKNPGIFAEKTIIAEKAVYKYDYNSAKIYQINVPPELIGKGIADSPLPLIFGAKASELKRRFSMKVATTKDPKTNEDIVWLYARPLLVEDQQEFKELNVKLEKKDLRAVALKQHDINEKSYKVFSLSDTKINSRLDDVIEDMRKFFTPITERGWETVVMDWNATAPSQPTANVGIPQPQIANPATYPYPNSNPTGQYRNEVPLYQL